LIQEYGALDIEEIDFLLKLLNAAKEREQIQGYLLCAESVGWLEKLSKGSTDFFVAKKTKMDAATIPLKTTAQIKNKTRRRVLIREHWKRTDAPRFKGIVQVFGEVNG
jgi:predicted RNA binding protein YcfA (HicA-like mRNA interferase family)